ncbi:MAG: hypothetical protein M1829_004965 [Trizodia sp. TS-e1964]|nr:MAG: hypothetical protein M1829_004965 [Trizodia sp. TS-e1964]
MMLSDEICNLCCSVQTVSSEVAKDPNETAGKAIERLYGGLEHSAPHHNRSHQQPHTPEDLQRAFECGKWGDTRPSDLFLQASDPMAGVVSPPLLGTSGLIPLSIFSTVPDICKHMSNVIARAQKEIILATNYWQNSDASKIITNSMKELSRRAGERGERVVMKVIYDRGSPKMFIENHQIVSESEYTGKNVALPSPAEIPNIDLQVCNYHRPILGTFHAKFMLADRKIAIVSSNNIQDNSNLEMMAEFQGPIIDSLYDMALITWHNAMNPPLPRNDDPVLVEGRTEYSDQPLSAAKNIDMNGGSSQRHEIATQPPMDHAEVMQSIKEYQIDDVGTQPNAGMHNSQHNTSAVSSKTPVVPIPGIGETVSERLPQHTSADEHYDPNISAEIARIQSGISAMPGESRISAVTRYLNTPAVLKGTVGDAPEYPPEEQMTPYIPHPTHAPFPMALVNRKPSGALNHSSVHVPQNEAWLSAIRNCQKSIFIQTPNMNAEPLIPALLEAARRGVQVTCYTCMGYNDTGELLPFQNGTNEMISHRLRNALSPTHAKNLHCYFYVAKDMTTPLHASAKRRTCHIKLLIVDDHIAIVGSGNQDTQSWFHSQETNVLLDSAATCKIWLDALARNQNTAIYGRVDDDGVWRYKTEKGVNGQQQENAETRVGKEVPESLGVAPGVGSWGKGFVGAIKRVQGKGGF